jgi:hypothetical protein
MVETVSWWAKGLLFENCNCQVLCRAHLNYRNHCDHERCFGYWGIHIYEGAFGDLRLDGINAFIISDTPRRMFDGDWTQAIYLDDRADQAQRDALEAIFKGKAGGTWPVLAALVSNWLETRAVPIEISDQEKRKSMRIEGLLDTTVEAIKSADRTGEVRLVNVHNQIHASDHAIATGNTRFEDRGLTMTTADTHAIYSSFSWRGP